MENGDEEIKKKSESRVCKINEILTKPGGTHSHVKTYRDVPKMDTPIDRGPFHEKIPRHARYGSDFHKFFGFAQ